MARAAAQLRPQMLALLGERAAPAARSVEPCGRADAACAALVAASGLAATPPTSSTLTRATRRVLDFLRRQAPQFAAAMGEEPLTVLAADGSLPLHPLPAALALGLGGVRRVSVQLLSGPDADPDAGPDAGPAGAAAYDAWACAIGVDVTVSARSPRDAGAQPAAVRVAASGEQAALSSQGTARGDGAPALAQILLAGAADDAWWEATRAAAMDAIVLGVRAVGPAAPSQLAPELTHAFVSSREHALGFHLMEDALSVLHGVERAHCASVATALLRAGCEVGAQSVREAMGAATSPWAITNAVMEVAASWPVGYRLAERCIGLGEFLGVLEDDRLGRGTPAEEEEGIMATCVALGAQ